MLEWVGGRLVAPFFITEGTPYRPEIILWLELPRELIVFAEVLDPNQPVSFAESLLRAMEAPGVGPARRPQSVRVAGEELAAEVRQVLPKARVVAAPTPELDRVIELMSDSMSAEKDGEEASYYEDGRVPDEAIADLFRAAHLLYGVAPWTIVADSQTMRVDIPALGVEGGCLSIIGALGESLGFLLFPSFEGYERYGEAAEEHRVGAPIDLGTSSLSLNYEAGCDLPAGMYREALQHGWPVADAQAFPMVQLRDRDAALMPLTEQEFRVVAACATSLSAFFIKHGDRFRRRELIEPLCESYFDNDDREVRFTVPYEAWPQFRVNRPPGAKPPAR